MFKLICLGTQEALNEKEMAMTFHGAVLPLTQVFQITYLLGA